jgi:hypothetical protein
MYIGVEDILILYCSIGAEIYITGLLKWLEKFVIHNFNAVVLH